MTSQTKPPKFDYHLLALLGWLCEGPNMRLLSSLGIGVDQTYPTLYELSPKREDGKRSITQVFPHRDSIAEPESIKLVKRLGGKVSNDYHKLLQSGFLTQMSALYDKPQRFKEFVEGLEPAHSFHYSTIVYFLTKQGLEYWKQTGKEQYQKLHAKKQAARKEADRLVLIGIGGTVRPVLPERLKKVVDNAGLRLPDISRKVVRPYAVARVTKETATRFYIEDVELLQGDKYEVSGTFYGGPIQGRAPNLFVEKTHVMLDKATKAGAAKVVATDVEYVESLQGIMLQTVERIVESVMEINSRLIQKANEREDVMADLLQSLRDEAAGSKAAPDGDDASPKGRKGPRRR